MGHLVDPSGRRQEGSTGEGRSKGCHRDFLALGGWRRGGTACTSGSAVRFGCHFEEGKNSKKSLEDILSLAPELKNGKESRRFDVENLMVGRHAAPLKHRLFLQFLHDCSTPKLTLLSLVILVNGATQENIEDSREEILSLLFHLLFCFYFLLFFLLNSAIHDT